VGVSWPGRSLAPQGGLSRPVEEVVALVGGDGMSEALTTALREITEAASAAFPENIYWDLEFLAVSLLRSGRAEGVEVIGELARRIAGLQDLYGQSTTIRFRYVHDFLYGFDWAKWVQREPGERALVGPFERAFLVHMEQRARELCELIAAGDATYPSLPEGQIRNPFPFSREPADEARLLRDLADGGLLPVETWDPGATPVWDRPYADLRARRAQALGIMLEN
jgi:hypothetical protein